MPPLICKAISRLSNLEFRLPKKEDQVARIGVMGGGLGNSGNARKKTLFFRWPLPLPTAHLIRTVLALVCFTFSISLLFSTPHNALKSYNFFCISFLWILLSLAAKVALLVTRLFLSSLPAPGKKTDQLTGIKFTPHELTWIQVVGKVVRVRPCHSLNQSSGSTAQQPWSLS